MDLVNACGGSPDLLTEVLASLQHGLVLADCQGEMVYANPATQGLVGWQPEELAGQPLSLLFPSDDHDYLYPNLLHLAAQGEGFAGEVMLQRQDGSRFFAFLTLRSCGSVVQSPLMALGIDDIDRQKRLEKMLGEARYQDLISVANGIAHELRNPLVGIGGFVNRLYKSCSVSLDHDHYYRYIINNLQRIEDLVAKVRDLVSLAPPQFSGASLRLMLEQAVEACRSRADQQGVAMALDSPDLVLRVDREQMLRGFAIVLDNALDALKGPGKVAVQGQATNGLCTITFADDGPGIEPRDLPHIFNPFFSTKADGIGIDLAVLKRIMENHGGRVEANSAPGQGAAFTLEFPLERRRAIRLERWDQKEPSLK